MKIVYGFLVCISMSVTLCNAMDDVLLRPVKKRMLDRWELDGWEDARKIEAVCPTEQEQYYPEEVQSEMTLANEGIQQEVTRVVAFVAVPKPVRTQAPFRRTCGQRLFRCTCGQRFYNKRMLTMHKDMHRYLKRMDEPRNI